MWHLEEETKLKLMQINWRLPEAGGERREKWVKGVQL